VKQFLAQRDFVGIQFDALWNRLERFLNGREDFCIGCGRREEFRRAWLRNMGASALIHENTSEESGNGIQPASPRDASRLTFVCRVFFITHQVSFS
jgi:hypothetical protein